MFDFDLTNWADGLVPVGTYEFEVLAFKCNNTAKTIDMSFAVVGTDLVHDERFHLLTRKGQKNRIGISSVLNMLKAIFPDTRITNITNVLLENALGKKFIGEIVHNEGDDGRVFANFLFYKYEPLLPPTPTASSNNLNIQNMKTLLEENDEA